MCACMRVCVCVCVCATVCMHVCMHTCACMHAGCCIEHESTMGGSEAGRQAIPPTLISPDRGNISF